MSANLGKNSLDKRTTRPTIAFFSKLPSPLRNVLPRNPPDQTILDN